MGAPNGPTEIYVDGAVVSSTNPVPFTPYDSSGNERGDGLPLAVAVVGFTEAQRPHIHKFGIVRGVSTSRNSVREGITGLFAYLGANTSIEIVQTGTQTVGITIEGLDSAGAEVTTTTPLSGVSGTAAAVASQYFRINRAYVAGSTELTSNVTIRIAGAGQTLAIVNFNYGQSLIGAYTIPAGYTGTIQETELGFSRNDDGEAYLMVREPSGVFRCRDIVLSGSGSVTRDYTGGGATDGIGPYAALTDIEWRCVATAGTIDVSAKMSLLLTAV